MDSAREVVIFRGIQELLGNVRQHAQATQVRLTLDFDGHRVRVAVEDNGKGFDPQAVLAGKTNGQRAAHAAGTDGPAERLTAN